MTDRNRRLLAVLAAALIGLVPASGARAAGELSPEAEQALVERVTREVVRELRESGVLNEEVKQGIADYIREQRAIRARAQNRARRQEALRARAVRPPTPGRDHIFGNPGAEISLIEYSDFECPFCKRFHPTARALVERYQGRVNWVYRHFPLAFHNPGAQKEAEGAECAAELGGNEAFWRFADAIFERTTSNGKGFPIERLAPLAAELGLDRAAFEECLDSGRKLARVKSDFDEGVRIGINGTPGNVLRNNRTGEVRVRAGAVPLEALVADVEALLK